jgi:hypothetical protein
VFESTNPRLDFSFLYPEGWDIREIKQKDYGEVIITGPRNKEDTYSLSLTIGVIPCQEEGRFSTVDEFVTDYFQRSKDLPGFKKVFTARGVFASCKATELVVSYVLSLPLNSLEAKETTILERRIITAKGAHFYEIVYGAVEEDYYTFFEVFTNVVRTFTFREEQLKQVEEFHPFVTPAPALAIREQAVDYEGDYTSPSITQQISEED